MSQSRSDVLKGISKPAIKRLSYAAGVKEVSGLVYEELRRLLELDLEEVLLAANTYAQYYNKITLNEIMISTALTDTGFPAEWSTNPPAKACPQRQTKKGKQRKAKRGVQALNSIRYYQKQSGCLYIPKAAFRRLAKEVAHRKKTRFSENALLLLQYVMEGYLVNLLEAAQLEALHAKRIQVLPKDIHLARLLMKRPS